MIIWSRWAGILNVKKKQKKTRSLQLVEVCNALTILGLALSWYIILKTLALLRRTISSINVMLIVTHCFQITFGAVYIKYLYNIGYSNIFQIPSGNEIEFDCKYFITFYITYFTFFSIVNCGIIFCRFVYVK